MVRMITSQSNLNGSPSSYKSSFYSEAEHDLKHYRKSDEDFSHLLESEPLNELGKTSYKNPGWKAIHQFCKAVNNEELTRDDFGLYDVADEHQGAYYYLCGSHPEDMGRRVLAALDSLHAKRDQQIRSRDYDPNSKGKFRTTSRKEQLFSSYPEECISEAITRVLNGEPLKDVAASIKADYSHLSQVLGTRYKFSSAKVTRARNSAKGRDILELSESQGLPYYKAAAELGVKTRTANTYINLYAGGEPTTYELSAETRKVLEKYPCA